MIRGKLLLTAAVAAIAAFAQPRPAASAKLPGAVRAGAPASYKDLKYPPPGALDPPKIQRFELPNGMKLFLLEDHEIPMVSGVAMVRTGSVFDPPDRAGLAALTGLLIRAGGSRLKTPDQLDLELEGLGASIDSAIGETIGTVTFSTLKENAAPALVLFRDILTAPAFRRDRLDLAKSRALRAIAQRNDDPRELLRREFRALLFGKDSPYSRRSEYNTITPIGHADVDSFYHRYFFPANTMLAISGDFDTAQMKGAIEALFSGWKAQQPAVPEFPKAGGSASIGGYLAFRPELRETYFAVGCLGADYKDKDSAAMDVAAAILGGSPQSRIMRAQAASAASIGEVRSEGLSGYVTPGIFVVSGSGMSIATADAVTAITGEIQRLRSSEVDEGELAAAKDAVWMRMATGLDNKARALATAATHEYYGYPAGFTQQYLKSLAAVTRADVQRVARERLDPEKFTVAAVSNLTAFSRPLDPRGGASQPIDLTIQPAKPAPAKSDTSSLDQGKQLLLRAQQASGGLEKLAAVKDLSVSIAYTLVGGGEDHETDQWIAPSHLREDGASSRVGTLIRYTDGANGWISNGRASAPLIGAALQQTVGDLLRLPIPMLLSDRIAGRVINALDDETIEIAQGDLIARVVFDRTTGLPSQLLYDLPTDKGLPVLYQEDLSDYRDVNGVKLPFATTIYQSGMKYAEGKVSDYKLNQGLRVEVLQRRP